MPQDPLCNHKDRIFMLPMHEQEDMSNPNGTHTLKQTIQVRV